MRRFTVVWHYVANFGTITLMAESPEAAMKELWEVFPNEEFHKKANVFVYEGEAVATHLSEVYPEKVSRW